MSVELLWAPFATYGHWNWVWIVRCSHAAWSFYWVIGGAGSFGADGFSRRCCIMSRFGFSSWRGNISASLRRQRKSMSCRFSRASFLPSCVVVLPPVESSLVSRPIWHIQREVFRGKYESKLLFRDAPKIQFPEAMTGKHRRRPISDRKCRWKAEEWGQKNPNRAILLPPFFYLLGHGRGNVRKWTA